MIKDRLETDTFSHDCKGTLHSVVEHSCASLQNLQSMLQVHTSLPYRSRGTWDRMGYGRHDLSEISTQVHGSVNLAYTINRELEE